MVDSISNQEVRELELLTDESLRRKKNKAAQLELILRLYIIFGVLIAIGALAYFGFSFLDIELTVGQRTSLIMAGAGFSISVMSAMLIIILGRQSAATLNIDHSLVLGSILVREWVKLENNGRLILNKRGVSFNSHSPRSIVSMLEKNGLISKRLSQDISIALDVRNKLVHHTGPVSQFELEEARRILTESNSVLEEMLNGADDGGEVLAVR